jgi:Type II secretion system (T2SS), protein J/Prokaryotic N-terminal methylation motif
VRGRAPRGGFTLIEVLAVVLMTALLMGVALDFYVNLSNESTRASDLTGEGRRATALLDRLAHEIESARMVKKPPETDPLAHPWVFIADSRYSDIGADRLKFVVQHSTPSAEGWAADVAMVAYVLRHAEDGDGYELMRWTQPGLPDHLDRDFPADGDPAEQVFVDGIESFGLRFLQEDGDWTDRWDSSQVVDSSELPLAVEIDVSFAPADPDAQDADAEPTVYTRQVSLPVRPLDLVKLLDPNTYAEGNGQGKTLADCVDTSRLASGGGASASTGGGGGGGDLSALFALHNQWQTLPFGPYRSLIPADALRPECK